MRLLEILALIGMLMIWGALLGGKYLGSDLVYSYWRLPPMAARVLLAGFILFWLALICGLIAIMV